MALDTKQRKDLRQMFGGRCAYCGHELPEKGWHADHVTAIYRNNPHKPPIDKPTIFPACAACNLHKSVLDLESWRKQLALQVARARRYSVNFRFAEKFGLVSETQIPIVFFFEKCKAREPTI